MAEYHLAQINIARMRAQLTDPIMSGFVAQLAAINAVADASPGFVWRLQSQGGDVTDLRPCGDESILVNLSVWEGVEHLRTYVYRSAHTGVMRDRTQWFEKFAGASYALWWIPIGHRPNVEEGKLNLNDLRERGATDQAFSFQYIVPPPSE